MHRLIIVMSVVGLAAFSARPAYAYLDPGSASIFIQLMIGALAGVAVGLKLYWSRLKQFVADRFGGPHKAPPGRSEPPAGT